MDDTETIFKALEGAEDFLQTYWRSVPIGGNGLPAHWRNRLHISKLSAGGGASSCCHYKWLAGLCSTATVTDIPIQYVTIGAIHEAIKYQGHSHNISRQLGLDHAIQE